MLSCGAGQRKLDGHGAEIFGTVRQLDGHAAFAQVGGHGAHLSCAVIDLDRDWGLDRDSGIAAPFAFHQGAHRAEAGFGAFRRKRLMKNEMGSQIDHRHPPPSGR